MMKFKQERVLCHSHNAPSRHVYVYTTPALKYLAVRDNKGEPCDVGNSPIRIVTKTGFLMFGGNEFGIPALDFTNLEQAVGIALLIEASAVAPCLSTTMEDKLAGKHLRYRGEAIKLKQHLHEMLTRTHLAFDPGVDTHQLTP